MSFPETTILKIDAQVILHELFTWNFDILIFTYVCACQTSEDFVFSRYDFVATVGAYLQDSNYKYYCITDKRYFIFVM